MAGEIPDASARVQDEVAAARRAAMLRLAIQEQEEKRYAQALDMFRQLIESYPGTEEESEARERMLDLAHLFGESQPYRMLSVYNTLENMYAPTSVERTSAARRARVKAILQEVHEQERREAETQARLEAIREGVEPPPEPARMSPRRREPAREPRSRATRREEGGDVA
jgi:predicted Zn-dependent peptidase